jgi:hypothetical protein
MQLQDLFYSKIFIGLDIHKKKLDSFYPNRFIFTDLFDAFVQDLYQYVERTFPDHAVDLVYEAGLQFSAARYFFKLGLECSSC